MSRQTPLINSCSSIWIALATVTFGKFVLVLKSPQIFAIHQSVHFSRVNTFCVWWITVEGNNGLILPCGDCFWHFHHTHTNIFFLLVEVFFLIFYKDHVENFTQNAISTSYKGPISNQSNVLFNHRCWTRFDESIWRDVGSFVNIAIMKHKMDENEAIHNGRTELLICKQSPVLFPEANEHNFLSIWEKRGIEKRVCNHSFQMNCKIVYLGSNIWQRRWKWNEKTRPYRTLTFILISSQFFVCPQSETMEKNWCFPWKKKIHCNPISNGVSIVVAQLQTSTIENGLFSDFCFGEGRINLLVDKQLKLFDCQRHTVHSKFYFIRIEFEANGFIWA